MAETPKLPRLQGGASKIISPLGNGEDNLAFIESLRPISGFADQEFS
jgi:hypothetical protein